MKFLIYFIAIIIAAIINTIFKDLNFAYDIAVAFSPDDRDKMVIIAGLVSGIWTLFSYGIPLYLASRINRHRDEKVEFKKCVADSGMSEFEYAKSITPEKVISKCDSLLESNKGYVLVQIIEELPNRYDISHPCADALIKGYTELMAQRRKESSKTNND